MRHFFSQVTPALDGIWSRVSWQACQKLKTAALAMSFGQFDDPSVIAAQLHWFPAWTELLPWPLPRIRLIMDCIDVDEDVVIEWLEHHFPWEALAFALRARPKSLLEIEIIHGTFAWAEEGVLDLAQYWLQEHMSGTCFPTAYHLMFSDLSAVL